MAIISGKTAAGLVAFVGDKLGLPYCYGTYGKVFTQSILDGKTKQYPAHYGSGRMAKYKQIVAQKLRSCDCVGLIKWYLWVIGNAGVEPSYNKDYDRSANGMYNAAKVKGPISTMPDRPGLCVRFDGHIGVYVGNGYVVEARGFAYGIVKTKLSTRPWTHWLECPYIDYKAAGPSLPEPKPEEKYPLGFGTRILKFGSDGEDVRCLQRALIALNYSVGRDGADGDFGTNTKNAVIAYQENKGLKPVDGKVGDDTRKALEADLPDKYDTDEADGEQTQPDARMVLFTGKPGEKANIRVTPGTAGRVMGIFRHGEALPWAQENTANGWVSVMLDGETGWVSGLYAALEG